MPQRHSLQKWQIPPQGNQLVLGLRSQPELGSFELSARTSLVLATHGAVVAAHGVERKGMERVLTEAASQPGARSHLQQSEEKHVRLC